MLPGAALCYGRRCFSGTGPRSVFCGKSPTPGGSIDRPGKMGYSIQYTSVKSDGFHIICLSVSHSSAANWNLSNSQKCLGSPYGGAVTALAVTERALDLSPKELTPLPWGEAFPLQIPIYRTGKRLSYPVGALIERPAEKFSIFTFLSAKRCLLTGIHSGIRHMFTGGQ